MARKNSADAALASLVGFFAIFVYPFVWIYEQIGGAAFIVLFLIISTAILLIIKHNRNSAPKAGQKKVKHTTQPKKQNLSVQQFKAKPLAANNPIYLKTDQAMIKYLQKILGQNGEGLDMFMATMSGHEEGNQAIQSLEYHLPKAREALAAENYELARYMYQKIGFANQQIQDEELNEAVINEQIAFVRQDTLFKDTLLKIRDVLNTYGPIKQTELYAEVDAQKSDVQYTLYFAERTGDVMRKKQGRSYIVSLPIR